VLKTMMMIIMSPFGQPVGALFRGARTIIHIN